MVSSRRGAILSCLAYFSSASYEACRALQNPSTYFISDNTRVVYYLRLAYCSESSNGIFPVAASRLGVRHWRIDLFCSGSLADRTRDSVQVAWNRGLNYLDIVQHIDYRF